MTNTLTHLGHWFNDRIEADKMAIHELARVTSVHKDSYIITKGHGDVFAELSGTLLFAAEFTLDLPTTGDWVYAHFHDDDTHGKIYLCIHFHGACGLKAVTASAC